MPGDEDRRSVVSWPGLFTALGVLYVPVFLVSGYTLQQADRMEEKLIARDDKIIEHCLATTIRLDTKVDDLEDRCMTLFYSDVVPRHFGIGSQE